MTDLKIVQIYILKNHKGSRWDGKRQLREMTLDEREDCLVFEKAEEVSAENQLHQAAKDTVGQLFGTGPKYGSNHKK